MLSGEEEGVYGWVATNLLRGTYKLHVHETIGTMFEFCSVLHTSTTRKGMRVYFPTVYENFKRRAIAPRVLSGRSHKVLQARCANNECLRKTDSVYEN